MKELSRLLGGSTFLESEFGKGSTFGIEIPIHYEPEPSNEFFDPLSKYSGINRLSSQHDSLNDTDLDLLSNETASAQADRLNIPDSASTTEQVMPENP